MPKSSRARLDAECLEVAQHEQRAVAVLDEDAFGDLQGEQGGIDVGGVQDAGHGGGETRGHQLVRGHVDRHGQIVAAAAVRCQWFRAAQARPRTHSADVGDQGDCSARGISVVGGTMPRVG